MVVAIVKTNDGSALLLGLSKENCKRLVDGEAILIHDKHPARNAIKPFSELLIMVGENEQTIMETLRKHGAT